MIDPFASKPGDTFAEGFRIVQELGKSADASALFAAEQSFTKRPCVLRLLHPRFVADKDGQARFEASSHVRAGIESEHVVELLAAGIERERGVPWYALEKLEGESLAAWFERGPLPNDDQVMALDIVEQLGAALTVVRAAGHPCRCIKPTKIFVATRRHHDGGVTVKLLDFWTDEIIRATDTPKEVTDDRETLAWLPPEMDEDNRSGSPASDVWGMGLVAFHLLAGKAYWKTLANVRASTMAVLREVAAGAQEPASVRAKALGFRRELPPGFDAWFKRCVATDASSRFANPDEAAEALSALLDPEAAGDEDEDLRTAQDEADERDEDEEGEDKEGEDEEAPPPPSKKRSKGKRAKAGGWRFPWADSPNLAVPVGLGLALALALGVRAIVTHSRARPGGGGGATTTAAATGPAPVNSASAPEELSAASRAALVAALRGSAGSPAWIAVRGDDPRSRRFGEDLARAFTEAGWQVRPIVDMSWPVRPGVFLFAADENAPSYVETAARALTAAGLQATISGGYRAFYNERVLTQPGYQGVAMAPDQTFVVLIGQIQ